MNTSDTPPDDSHWSSLAQELGLDSTPPAAAPPEAATELSNHLIELPDAHDDEDTMLEPVLSAEPVVESADGEESTSEDQPDEGGKRRRRRRRRRRKGGGEATAEAGAEGEEQTEEGFAEEEEPAEAPANAIMRDVVANWNVPSWDELIGGLYRPGN